MLGSARGTEVPVLEPQVEVREPWGSRTDATEGRGSVARVEYLPGIGWISRDPVRQSEKRSPR